MSSKGLLLKFIYWCLWLTFFNIHAAEKSKQQQEQQQQQQQPKEEKLATFWDTVPPGVLLQNLDALTADATSFFNVVPAPKNGDNANGRAFTTPIPKIQAIVTKRFSKRDTLHEMVIGASDRRRVSEVSVDNNAEESAATAAATEPASITIPYDYDRVYEEFVKKYFDGAIAKELAEDNANTEEKSGPTAVEHVEKVSNKYDTVKGAESRTRKHKIKTCKTVTKYGQKCQICKNPRNGETSEACSYNRESSPSKYAFKKKSDYSKYHNSKSDDSNEGANDDDDDEQSDDDDDDSDQAGEDGKKSPSIKSHTKVPIEELYTKCLVRYYKHKICYRCENDDGDKLHKCYGHLSDKGYHHQSHHQPLHKKSQQQHNEPHRRHYKHHSHHHKNHKNMNHSGNKNDNHKEKSVKNIQHKKKRNEKSQDEKKLNDGSSLYGKKQMEERQSGEVKQSQSQSAEQPQKAVQSTATTATAISQLISDYTPRQRIAVK